VLIAGTYTPLMLLTMKDQLGMTMFIIIWLIAFVGILFKIKFGHRFKKLSLITYIGMGTISLLIIHRLQQALTSNAMILLALGGLVYLLGVYFYIQKKIPYNHAIWHLFVLAGASLHFFMIWLYV
jgi:hemolysin III